MKARAKVAVAILAVVLPCGFFLAHRIKVERDLRKVRQQLQSEGFKTDLADFTFRPPHDAVLCGYAVAKADLDLGTILANDVRSAIIKGATSFGIQTSNSAVVAWKNEFLAGPTKRSPWPGMRQTLEKSHAKLDSATDALMKGLAGFNFNIEVDAESEPAEWTHIYGAGRALSVNLLVDLYYGERVEAWRHLFALTRLTASSQVAPPAHVQRAALRLSPVAFVATWQALQARIFSEDQLSALIAEWSHADFFRSLPDAVAFDRTYLAALWEHRRRKPEDSEFGLHDLFREPKNIPSLLKYRVQSVWYTWSQSFTDEKNLLLYLRDPNWMCVTPLRRRASVNYDRTHPYSPSCHPCPR